MPMAKSYKKGRGKVLKDKGRHAVPGRVGQDGHPESLPARTGYTDGAHNRTGGSKTKSRQGVNFPSKDS